MSPQASRLRADHVAKMAMTTSRTRTILTRRLHVFVRRLCWTPFVVLACDPLSHPGDTAGEQIRGRWEWSGRIAVDTHPTLTLVRLDLDTAGITERHDVVLTGFHFDPTGIDGDEYQLTLALDLGRVSALPINEPLALGPPPAPIPAYATVACLCAPLRPDSVRGTYRLGRRGLRQLDGRIDATLFFTAWHDSTHHVSYPLRQIVYAVK